MAEFRARMAQGGGPGGAGGQGFGGPGGGGGFGGGPGGGTSSRPRPESNEPKAATVYLKAKSPADAPSGQAVLRAVAVRLGIADGTNVEVMEGLKENDEVVSGTITAPTPEGPRNPFSPFGGPRRPR